MRPLLFVVYALMAVWLLIAGARRIAIELSTGADLDWAAFASGTIGGGRAAAPAARDRRLGCTTRTGGTMTRGPYAPEPGHDQPAGHYVGFRQWVALPCLQDRHEKCHDLQRCDCRCHALITGAFLLHMEPA